MLAVLCYVLRVRHCLSVYLCVRVYLCLLYAGLTYLWLYACSTRITLHLLELHANYFKLALEGKSKKSGELSVPSCVHGIWSSVLEELCRHWFFGLVTLIQHREGPLITTLKNNDTYSDLFNNKFHILFKI